MEYINIYSEEGIYTLVVSITDDTFINWAVSIFTPIKHKL